jgi:hypothetical protein
MCAANHRDSTGSSYHQELARELAEFLVPILDRQGGMKSLADVYCLFNRARGVGKFAISLWMDVYFC